MKVWRVHCDTCGPSINYATEEAANTAKNRHHCLPPGMSRDPRVCRVCGGVFPVDYLAVECAQRDRACQEVPA